MKHLPRRLLRRLPRYHRQYQPRNRQDLIARRVQRHSLPDLRFHVFKPAFLQCHNYLSNEIPAILSTCVTSFSMTSSTFSSVAPNCTTLKSLAPQQLSVTNQNAAARLVSVAAHMPLPHLPEIARNFETWNLHIHKRHKLENMTSEQCRFASA